MTHASAIRKNTRTKLAKQYRVLYREERKDYPDQDVDNVEIAKKIGTIHEEGEPPVDFNGLILQPAHDSEARLCGVEVWTKQYKRLFVQPFDEPNQAPSMKTEIVFINEGKGTVRKFEITVPSDTV